MERNIWLTLWQIARYYHLIDFLHVGHTLDTDTYCAQYGEQPHRRERGAIFCRCVTKDDGNCLFSLHSFRFGFLCVHRRLVN